MRLFCVGVVVAILMAPVAWAQGTGPAYVGLFEKVGAGVTAKSSAGTAFQPAAFARVRLGDELDLPQGAEVQIVYFETRKREQWQGPTRFRVQAEGGERLAGNAQQAAQIKGVPARTTLATAGNVQRIGGLTLRGAPTNVPDDAAIAQARNDYATWISQADPQDVLPELYMIGFLESRRDPALLAPYVDALLKKRPDQPEAKALAQRLGLLEARP